MLIKTCSILRQFSMVFLSTEANTIAMRTQSMLPLSKVFSISLERATSNFCWMNLYTLTSLEQSRWLRKRWTILLDQYLIILNQKMVRNLKWDSQLLSCLKMRISWIHAYKNLNMTNIGSTSPILSRFQQQETQLSLLRTWMIPSEVDFLQVNLSSILFHLNNLWFLRRYRFPRQLMS